jgi:glycosyltransferase involved in cell wall biosynthesis
MTVAVLRALEKTGRIAVCPVSSRSSLQWPGGSGVGCKMPWSSQPAPGRLLADHFHPWLVPSAAKRAVWYYPKGFLPVCGGGSRRIVVTIHDTILQHNQDYYPEWRSAWDYRYWLGLLAHTLRRADRILTVSGTAKEQIEAFMQRRGMPPKEILVTYEPCAYEGIAQPITPGKGDYVMHLASVEPHKGTARLVRCWHDAEKAGGDVPVLRLVGRVPPEVAEMVQAARTMASVGFLSDEELQACYQGARALVFPSEIEGFGLPALEAYYLGTPVCFVKGTSVEEVLSVATRKGGFDLADPESLFAALDEVLAMTPEEVRECGLILRGTYASAKVAEKMVRVFEEVVQR